MISIITVNLNNATGLLNTINSVIRQTYKNYEYIIIDGGSCDESIEIIQKYQSFLTYWQSEPDDGIYFGMNEGIKYATGEYCLFLNSGDYFIDDKVLERVFENQKYTEDLIIGRRLTLKNNGIKSKSRKLYIDDIDKSYFYSNTLPHQCTFIKTSLLKSCGGYHTDYKIVSDWIFWIEAIIARKASIRIINDFIAINQPGGISSNKKMCHDEMSRYLMQKNLSQDDWLDIIAMHHDAYVYKCATRSKIGRFLIKVAKYISK